MSLEFELEEDRLPRQPPRLLADDDLRRQEEEYDAEEDIEDDDEENDDDDACMPELGCEFSVEDLCCDADDEAGAGTAAIPSSGRRGAGGSQPSQPPRRLTLQQRRRLNLYSKPSGLPARAAAGSNGASGDAATPAGGATGNSDVGSSWAIHDTPTIHEEDSGMGSVASPEPLPDLAEFPGWRRRPRNRTLSEPPLTPLTGDPTEDPTVAAAVAAAEAAGSSVVGGGGGGGGGGRRIRTQSTSQVLTSPGSRWPKALSLAFQTMRNDAWRDKAVAKMPEEEVVRHQYNPHRRQWVQDRVRVKIEPEPFDQGAMRQCYRLKKLSTFSRMENWNSSACNYVAKKYIEDVDNSVYFEDVRLQMNAKLWAQEYNRHQPPKKVDMMQMCVIEFVGRPDSPMYHLEHYIEGEYVKYNSNSGFVDEKLRQTPHALSHFTFERSGHQLIVVDIQGVDDIYTDPQIHTASGTEYGDGNLGVRGMALFFQSHVCNDICRKMGLSQFDLGPTEIACQTAGQSRKASTATAETCVRGDILLVVGSPPTSPASCVFDSGCSTDEDEPTSQSQHATSGGGGGAGAASWMPVRRRRNESGELTPEEELVALSVALKLRQRPSCVQGVLAARRGGLGMSDRSRSRSDSGSSELGGGSYGGGVTCLPGMPEIRVAGPVLGRVHHELARLHESGRFSQESVDWEAALFHEKISAQLGVVEAAANLARLHMRLPSDCLQEMPVEVLKPDPAAGLAYLESAARLGDRSAMLQLARAHDQGHPGLPSRQDWDRAAHYYQQALAMCGQADKEGGYDCLDTPSYALRARLAEMYLAGGHGLDPDPAASYDLYGEAAEDAMAQGNGKLATKYYALAEEASAMIDE